ncbi:alpha-ketoacid dehydrogenase subunit beta [Lachnoclostridium sp. An131]|uniref:alpha-ketoacid dehydrogenase subunit beta n=1 Tax=Lachnoclostridium sp. An131 TaxID=1965555 RepID=UPI0023B91700|nr:alpha-ketoacid dehydrogenase subunit beta [Lachnoclostridium sp. An131]
MESTRIVQALRQALIEEMDRDENVVLLGEDIGVFNGSYRVTEGLLDKYGEKRVKDTPISEISITGAAIGAAMTGLRPVAEIQFNDFMGCAMDQICNQAAKIRLMMGGQVSVPMVIRAPYGATGRAAQHSQSLEAWFAHIPGLKVVMPSTPYDAKGLLKMSIRDNNPVIFLEHKLLYGATSPGGKAKSVVDDLDQTFRPAPEEEYMIELGKGDVKRQGEDVTVVAVGYMVHRAVQAAKIVAEEGIECEIIDPRTIVPLDKEIILNSVKKTGRLVIVTESAGCCGFAAEVAAVAVEEGLFDLDAPVKRVCAKESPIPFAPCCEADVLPDTEKIVKAVKEICRK